MRNQRQVSHTEVFHPQLYWSQTEMEERESEGLGHTLNNGL